MSEFESKLKILLCQELLSEYDHSEVFTVLKKQIIKLRYILKRGQYILTIQASLYNIKNIYQYVL